MPTRDDVDAFAEAVARALEAHRRAEEEYAAFRAEHAQTYRLLEGFPTQGVSMSWEAFHVQERRWRRDLDAFLIERIRTPERVQSGRAPRSQRRTRSGSASRDGPLSDDDDDPPNLETDLQWALGVFFAALTYACAGSPETRRTFLSVAAIRIAREYSHDLDEEAAA
jgi:hypothetical protein